MLLTFSVEFLQARTFFPPAGDPHSVLPFAFSLNLSFTLYISAHKEGRKLSYHIPLGGWTVIDVIGALLMVTSSALLS